MDLFRMILLLGKRGGTTVGSQNNIENLSAEVSTSISFVPLQLHDALSDTENLSADVSTEISFLLVE